MSSTARILSILSGSVLLLAALIMLGVKGLRSDPYAVKMLHGPYHSMIIGDSRAVKLDATMIQDELGDRIGEGTISNFAFNLEVSPFGPLYVDQILSRSIDQDTNSIFIISIDPWMFAADTAWPDDATHFREAGSFMEFDASGPFPELRYFLAHVDAPFYTALLSKPPTSNESTRPDSAFIAHHTNSKLRFYEHRYLHSTAISGTRYASFERLLSALDRIGQVYIIRLPVPQVMLDMEQRYAPDLFNRVQRTAQERGIDLIDLTPYRMDYLCVDGVHLFRPDAERVSELLGQVIAWDLGRGQKGSGEEILSAYAEQHRHAL